MNKSTVARVVVLGALLLAGGGLTLWKVRAINAASSGGGGGFEPTQAVEVVEVGTAPWRPTAELSGTVLAKQSVTLGCEVAGTIKEVMFESGAVVEQGQALVTLDSAVEEANLRSAAASVHVAEAEAKMTGAELRLAESNVGRLTVAIEARASSQAELDQARAGLETGRARLLKNEAELEQMRARVDQMQAEIAKKTLRAPFRARAGLRNVHPGQYLAEGAVVVGLQSVTDDVYLDFALPQDQVVRVAPGDVVMAHAPMLGEEPLRVEVVAIDATADRVTRNVRVRAVVPNRDQRLRPGMFVDIVAPVGEPREYTVIPGTAVRRASFGDHVFVVVPDEKDPSKLRARQRIVKLGPAVGQSVVVLDGLKPGERIAATGSFKLREDAAVMAAAPGQAAGADGAGAVGGTGKH